MPFAAILVSLKIHKHSSHQTGNSTYASDPLLWFRLGVLQVRPKHREMVCSAGRNGLISRIRLIFVHRPVDRSCISKRRSCHSVIVVFLLQRLQVP